MRTSLTSSPRAPAGLLSRARGPAVVLLTLAVPVVLVVGGLVAEALQPPGTYDPVGQTVSTLAGRGAADRWLMAGTLAGVGVAYLLVAAGLRGASRAARAVLATGGGCVVLAALAAQPAHGSSTLHMIATVAGALAFVVWPLPLAADPAQSLRMRRGSLAATAAMTVALGWLCAQAWTDGTWLGVAERVLILSQTVWPIRVAVVSWPGLRRRRGWTTLALALMPPVVFVAGVLAAQAAQPGPDPIDRSLSALAGHGASSAWIAAGTLALVGTLHVLVAAGMRSRVPTAAWVLLGTGGAMLLVAGLSPQPVEGYSTVHMVSAGLAWAGYTAWPLGLSASAAVDRRLRWASAAAVVVLAALVAWFTAQLVTEGTWYGLSERIVILAESVWPIVVAAAMLTWRRSPRPRAASRR